MNYLSAAVISALAFAALISPTAAQPPPPDLFNPQIEFEYAKPGADHPEFLPIYERLQARKALELFRQFLAPLKLKEGQKLLLRVDQCGGPYDRSRRKGVATICYELVYDIERLAPTGPIELLQTVVVREIPPAESGVVGPFIQAMLHEAVIAVFDLLEVPVLGREEDAADRSAALIMMQFSKHNMAWWSIVGTAWFLAANTVTAADPLDVRGIMAQRYYTMLCIAYGGDRTGHFKNFVARERQTEQAAGDLPPDRARECPEEYRTVARGFQETIGREYLDQAKIRQVEKIKWIY